jgi:predicted SnoaL-like aldol condensation-catalyzing enzyme
LRNHDVEQPSGGQAFATYVLKPADHGAPNTPDQRVGTLPARALRLLFAITDGDLTMMAYPTGGGGDPSARFGSNMLEVKNGRVTQMWYSGPTTVDPGAVPLSPPVPDDLTAWFPAPGDSVGRLALPLATITASRAQRDANKQVVEQFIRDFFVRGDTKAAQAVLSPDLKSHVPGVPSGHDFAVVAHKHQDKVVAPDPQQELFALADGELVAIGFPVPYAGDAGAWYAQTIVRVRHGRITEWWYSGYPAGHPRRVWKMPRK